ncbi:beta/alpha barrel domain-containing protein [Sphingobacterium chuzhouense]|uniref:Bifunctional 4-hydroxy-2-oxoglutarate aldolase/2-dehydro-3-deoxy-phosphogluconate aldolase n=1 Tax=Sphingobacterium chuzhouense TaxID=1742264 RepID=A0ABR7XT05_9SPHI|nr:bifunctional 4-hydroxy-2-oxoglutarate aldolase/2-dehydro-3-deoxy-phosphogluconate aldolase [Sphingobacterium chuzhouense]MBD1422309.1 bifunctional 4-hydroxy-2-oxoglutarate aldolase/2-dehydro-3-deoxy-phosphogluconate aldolase [Sphingobacterium chuzhouense]
MTEQKKEASIIDLISSSGILPMFIHEDVKLMKSILAICYEAELRVFEVLNRSENALHTFIQLKDYVDNWLPGMKLCAGTITDVQSAKKYIDAGAAMIIAPNLDEQIGHFCVEQGIEWLPGVSTVSEIYKALKIGTTSVKLFPAELSSPKFVLTIKSLVPRLQIIASGGVSVEHESLGPWFMADVDGVGLGSSVFNKVNQKDGWESTKETLLSCKQRIKKLRQLRFSS